MILAGDFGPTHGGMLLLKVSDKAEAELMFVSYLLVNHEIGSYEIKTLWMARETAGKENVKP